MLDEVGEALARTPKELPSKYFYDAEGARLFERITELPEYYLTRTETALLADAIPLRVAALAPRCIVELGPGGADKGMILLRAALQARPSVTYVPVDVSAAYLDALVEPLAAELPQVEIRPLLADFSTDADAGPLPSPALHAFLGSTIGNFDGDDATALLARVRRRMRPEDRLLLGTDLRPGPRKPRELLERAYDDEAGVTAEFNRNILRVLNRELGADFRPEAFAHRAFYDARLHRIEMHLVASEAHIVHLPGRPPVRFDAGESVRTEISCKYDREAVERLLRSAGLRLESWHTDAREWFACSFAVAVTS